MYGFLKVPADGVYNLLMSTNDDALVYLNKSGRDPTGMEEILLMDGDNLVLSLDDFYENSEQISEDLTLDADTYYYVEIWHLLQEEPAQFRLGISAENPNTNLYDDPISHPLNPKTIQKVTLDTNGIKESHTLIILDPPAVIEEDSHYEYAYQLNIYSVSNDNHQVETTSKIVMRADEDEFLAAFDTTSAADLDMTVILTAYDDNGDEMDLSLFSIKSSSFGSLKYQIFFNRMHVDNDAFLSAEPGISISGDLIASANFDYEEGPAFTREMTGIFGLQFSYSGSDVEIPAIPYDITAEDLQYKIDTEFPALKHRVIVKKASNYSDMLYGEEYILF